MEHNPYGKVFVDGSHSHACFSQGVLYVYYFWPHKAGLVVSHAKFTCERRSFKEISLEFLFPWPACAVRPPEDTLPPFLQSCVCVIQMEKTPGKQVRAPHGLSCCRQLGSHGSGKGVCCGDSEPDQDSKFPWTGEGAG